MSNFKIHNLWHTHTKDKTQKDEIKALVFEARLILERLDKVLDDKIEACYRDMRKTSNFEDASWTHKMADQLGYCRALDEIKTLIKIKHQEQ